MRQIGEIANNVKHNVEESERFYVDNVKHNVEESERFYVDNVKHNVEESERFYVDNVKHNVRKADWTQAVAIGMCEKLKSPKDLNFFLKCAWHLSEDTIWSIVESASGKRNPLHYATAALRNQLSMRGVK